MEDENNRLKFLVADLTLDCEALKELIRKNGWNLPIWGLRAVGGYSERELAQVAERCPEPLHFAAMLMMQR
jgi:hypothetical protein